MYGRAGATVAYGAAPAAAKFSMAEATGTFGGAGATSKCKKVSNFLFTRYYFIGLMN